MEEILFYKIWRNIVINRVIFKYVKLYRNKFVEFKSLQSLKTYGGREFITKIRYIQDNHLDDTNVLSKGDLPENCILKEVDLSFYEAPIKNVNIFPLGLEVITFCEDYYSGTEIVLSQLPLSVTTVSNLILKRPYINSKIPNNITSVSFNTLDASQLYDIVFPNSLLKLDLGCLAKVKEFLPTNIPASKINTFIPSSVTDLDIFYDSNYKSRLPKIPSSVNKLQMFITDDGDDGNNNNYNIEEGLIPFGVKYLIIDNIGDCNITIPENSLPTSITRLVINTSHRDLKLNISENSIPNSVLDLTILFSKFPSSLKNLLPNSLTKLSISSNQDVYPPIMSDLPSIKHFEIDHNPFGDHLYRRPLY